MPCNSPSPWTPATAGRTERGTTIHSRTGKLEIVDNLACASLQIAPCGITGSVLDLP